MMVLNLGTYRRMGFNLMIDGRLETQKVTIMCVFLQKPLFGAKARTLVLSEQ